MKVDYENMLEVLNIFVSTKTGIEKSKLTEETKIEGDVGIAGLDTYQFYDDFFTEFKITNPSDFEVDEYVTSENLEIGKLFNSIFSKTQRQKLKTKNNTIRHLINVAVAKKWSDE